VKLVTAYLSLTRPLIDLDLTDCQSGVFPVLMAGDLILSLTRINWAGFQACLEDRLPGNPAVNDDYEIDKCVEELTSAIQEAMAASAPKRRHGADPWPPLTASIQDKITPE
jgi:hypothetical protein